MKFSFEEFVAAAWDISGRKVNKMGWLEDFYLTAKNSIGLPIAEDSLALKMFKIILQEHQTLCATQKEIEKSAEFFFEG